MTASRQTPLVDLLVASMTSPSQAFSRDQREFRMLQAIETLPEEARTAIQMRYVQGLPTKQIADEMGKGRVFLIVCLSLPVWLMNVCVWPIADWRTSRSELPASYGYLSEHRAIIGTPDQCVAKIQSLQQQGIDYFGCNFSFGGMEHDKLLRSMKLFSQEVVPHFS